MTSTPTPTVKESLPVPSDPVAAVREALHVAAGLANGFFNLSQRTGRELTADDCRMLREMVERWDATRPRAALLAQLEAAQKDQARYRWLLDKARTEGRDGGTSGFWRLPFIDGWGHDCKTMRAYNHATLDAAIDAALAEQQEGKP